MIIKKIFVGIVGLLTSVAFAYQYNPESMGVAYKARLVEMQSSLRQAPLKQAKEVAETISAAIHASPTGARVVILGTSVIQESELTQLEHNIYMAAVNQHDPYTAMEDSVSALIHLHKITGSAPVYHTLWNYARDAVVEMAIIASYYEKKENSKNIQNKDLIGFVEKRVGVCDHITAYAYSLFKSKSQFKDAYKLVPLSIGNHVVLLIQSALGGEYYIFDAWLPYLYIQGFELPDASKVFFGTPAQYRELMSDRRYTPTTSFLSTEVINNITDEAIDVGQSVFSQNHIDPWIASRLDRGDEPVKKLRNALIKQSQNK